MRWQRGIGVKRGFAAFIKGNGITEFYIAGEDAATCIKLQRKGLGL